jgi:hypothetical protein
VKRFGVVGATIGLLALVVTSSVLPGLTLGTRELIFGLKTRAPMTRGTTST